MRTRTASRGGDPGARHGLPLSRAAEVVTYQGHVVDSYHVLEACSELGIPCRAREWAGTGPVVEHYVSRHLAQRNLTPAQKALLAYDASGPGQVLERAAHRPRGELLLQLESGGHVVEGLVEAGGGVKAAGPRREEKLGLLQLPLASLAGGF